MSKQLTLFGDEVVKKARKVKGGSHNPIVFYDYDTFVAKFTDKAKTTDDCYTPRDVYDAVVKYVGTIIDLSGKVICRPFYPGGDYENAEYPENGVVIDNPPFSIFLKICRFYSESEIPFFLFGPAMTIMRCCKYCTAVVSASQVKFDNGAVVPIGFASNLYKDAVVITAPILNEMIKSCESQLPPPKQKKYIYPREVLNVSQLQRLVESGEEFAVKRNECFVVNNLDNYGNLFGSHLLLSKGLADEKELRLARIEKKKKEDGEIVNVELSDRETRMLEKLV